MKAQEAWYIDDGVPIEGILVKILFSRPVFFPRSMACGFFSQAISRRDMRKTIFFSEESTTAKSSKE